MIFEKGDRILFAGDSVTDMGSNQPIGELNGLGNTTYVNMMHCFSTSSYPELELRLSNAGHSGATTLWEYWPHHKHIDSKNHHMYSDFMSWIVKNLLGINCKDAGFKTAEINLFFPQGLDFAKGSCYTVFGKVAVEWERCQNEINIKIFVPNGMDVYYKNQKLPAGESTFNIKE